MQRVKEFDSIRGLASLAIVVYHLWLSNIGLLGAAVDLFFVLSGFLITSILLTQVMSHRFLVSFYARRALRIWPAYYLSLMILVLLNPFASGPGSLDGLPYFATFTQNITYYWSDSTPAFIPAFRHTWSVAIEEQFYVFWPPLLWVVGRRGITLATMCLIAVAVTTRILQFNSWILITHCDGLALGALLAHWSVPAAQGESRREPRFLMLGLASAGFWVGGAPRPPIRAAHMASWSTHTRPKLPSSQSESRILRFPGVDGPVQWTPLDWHLASPMARLPREDQLWPVSLSPHCVHVVG